ncbi:MAG: hypothetical protein PVI23_13365 [Maricaulaceae bacterium]|jgi:hypothetical protein
MTDLENTEWHGEVRPEGKPKYPIRLKFLGEGVAAFQVQHTATGEWRSWFPTWEWSLCGQGVRFGAGPSLGGSHFIGTVYGQTIIAGGTSTGARREMELSYFGVVE